METKILENKLNLGEGGFYFIKMKYANEYMPLNWFEVFQVDEDDYITDMSYGGRDWGGNPDIIYTTYKGLHLGSTETFKTKEQALQYARELNIAKVHAYLDNVMEATNFLGERELLDLEDRFLGFLMEIKARFNAFEKSEDQTEGEE